MFRSILILSCTLMAFVGVGQIRNGDFENVTSISNGLADFHEWNECSVSIDSNAYSGNVALAISQYCTGIELNPGGIDQMIFPVDSTSFDTAGAIYMYVNIPNVPDSSTYFGAYIVGHGTFPRESVGVFMTVEQTSGYQLWWAPYNFSYRPDSLELHITNGNGTYIGGGGISDTILVDSIYFGAYRAPLPYIGIKEIEVPQVHIYPVPVGDVLRWKVESEDRVERIQVLSANGQPLQSEDHPETDYIRVTHLLPGVYFLRMEMTDGSIYHSRFIKIE